MVRGTRGREPIASHELSTFMARGGSDGIREVDTLIKIPEVTEELISIFVSSRLPTFPSSRSQPYERYTAETRGHRRRPLTCICASVRTTE